MKNNTITPHFQFIKSPVGLNQSPFEKPTFNEFVVDFGDGFGKTHERLIADNIIAGLPLECYYPELANHYLLCVTETLSKEDMDELVKKIK